jgi:hypothetical protein
MCIRVACWPVYNAKNRDSKISVKFFKEIKKKYPFYPIPTPPSPTDFFAVRRFFKRWLYLLEVAVFFLPTAASCAPGSSPSQAPARPPSKFLPPWCARPSPSSPSSAQRRIPLLATARRAPSAAALPQLLPPCCSSPRPEAPCPHRVPVLLSLCASSHAQPKRDPNPSIELTARHGTPCVEHGPCSRLGVSPAPARPRQLPLPTVYLPARSSRPNPRTRRASSPSFSLRHALLHCVDPVNRRRWISPPCLPKNRNECRSPCVLDLVLSQNPNAVDIQLTPLCRPPFCRHLPCPGRRAPDVVLVVVGSGGRNRHAVRPAWPSNLLCSSRPNSLALVPLCAHVPLSTASLSCSQPALS